MMDFFFFFLQSHMHQSVIILTSPQFAPVKKYVCVGVLQLRIAINISIWDHFLRFIEV